MRDLERLRWHCRRGLLELDLVLGRFLELHLHDLDAAQREILGELLEHADNDLLDWALGREDPPDPRYRGVIELLRASGMRRMET
jgi:antitoxin CptB